MSTVHYDVNTLIELWNEGLSASEIGARLGVTKNAVIGKVRRLRESGAALRLRLTAPAVTILDLRPDSCRYIAGATHEGEAVYCGESVLYRSYCAAHASLCYRRTAPAHVP